MTTVYVTQENSRLNYSDAERFGEIEFLTDREYNPIPGSKRNARTMTDIYTGLSGFDPTKDHLLLSGDPIIMALAVNVVAEKSRRNAGPYHGKISVLKWDGQKRRYNPIVLDVSFPNSN